MPNSPDAPIVLPELPLRLASVFRALRSGRHLSRNDGQDFIDLERRHSLYEHVFQGLGYKLRQHNQGFYYLEGVGAIKSERMRAALLFLLIIFQDLEERKFSRQSRAWERSLLTTTFKLVELPHFQTAQRRALMSAVDIDEAALPKLLRSLVTLGVVQTLPDNQFRFLPPIYRFVDLCMRFADDDSWSQALSSSAPPTTSELDDSSEDDDEEAAS
jgi:hypothetical protein